MIGCLAILAIILAVAAIIWIAKNVGPYLPYLLAAAALYGAGIALLNYGRAFANNVKPGRPAP